MSKVKILSLLSIGLLLSNLLLIGFIVLQKPRMEVLMDQEV